jgi:hypothetical protein
MRVFELAGTEQVFTWGRWLKAQRFRDDPIGDLARDWLTDCGHRKYSSPGGVRKELDRHRACEGAYEALDEAIKEWGGGR